MDNISLWAAISTGKKNYPTLMDNKQVDVVIVGGGITGITAAMQLIAAGKKVSVLEAHQIGSGTTAFSTGNLYVAVQPYYQHMVAKFNLETAKIIAHSRKKAIDFIEHNVRSNNSQCQFTRRPWYFYTNDEDQLAFLEKEIETMKKLDLDIDYVKDIPLALQFKKAAMMKEQARFNPLQYVIDMAEVAEKQGCLIFENSPVVEFSEKKMCVVKTPSGTITAQNIILATHTPIGINMTQMYTAPYRSYVVGVHVKNHDYPEGHFWDVGEPHHAVCTHAVHSDHPELLLVAGSHHKTGQGTNMQSHYEALQTYLRQHFPVYDVAYQWSAQHYQSADTVPYIGLASRFAKNIYMATGYFADGLVYGTIAGWILSDLIAKNKNELTHSYEANRFKPFASAGFLAKEGTNVFLQYLKDVPSFHHDYHNLKAGDGCVVEINREKCAVSRDEHNRLHIVSAVCPHMKCIVHWNNAERTWDCPCHGSRFTQQGKYIEGPAKSDLAPKEG